MKFNELKEMIMKAILEDEKIAQGILNNDSKANIEEKEITPSTRFNMKNVNIFNHDRDVKADNQELNYITVRFEYNFESDSYITFKVITHKKYNSTGLNINRNDYLKNRIVDIFTIEKTYQGVVEPMSIIDTPCSTHYIEGEVNMIIKKYKNHSF